MGEGNEMIKKILSPKWARKEKKGIQTRKGKWK